jgi:hypothetical protein
LPAAYEIPPSIFRADLERHRETRLDVDDRQIFSLARDPTDP